MDQLGPLAADERLPIERPAAPIMDRAPVTVPLQTGIKVIDALIPVGRGQRELILGDRQTGKTAIAPDTIFNQRDKNVICVLLRHWPARFWGRQIAAARKGRTGLHRRCRHRRQRSTWAGLYRALRRNQHC